MMSYDYVVDFSIQLRSLCDFKGWVHCFSMQVVMNMCFLLNPQNILAQIHLVIFE